MNFIRLVYKQDNYSFDHFNPNENIGILGLFLTLDAKFNENFRKYFHDDSIDTIGGNLTTLEKKHDYVTITDIFQDDTMHYPKEINISNAEFTKILNIWFDDIYATKPKHVIIKHENDEFTIETSD